jgi:hypothetical protein
VKKYLVCIVVLLLLFGFFSPVAAAAKPTPLSQYSPNTSLASTELNALNNMSVGGFFGVFFRLPSAFAGQELIWSSSNPDVAWPAAVKGKALIVAKSPGTTVITVKSADDKFSYSFPVGVQ